MFTRAAHSIGRPALALAACLLAIAFGAGSASSASADAPATVAAFDLTASNNARPGYARTIAWDIGKSVDQTRQNIAPGGVATFNYTVTVTHDGGTDSNWQVAGEVVVTNPNSGAVDGVVVSEAINDSSAACVVSGGSPTIPAGGAVAFDYTCTYSAAPDSASQTSTDSISWPEQTLSDLSSLPAGSTSTTADVVWGEPTAILNGSVDVSDSLAGVLGSVFYADPSPQIFSYAYEFQGDATGTCTTHDNIATVSNDGLPIASALASVEVCVGAAGKTFTIGPSSMEGHLTIHAGDIFNGGYSFKFKNSTHAATQFSVGATVAVPVTCPKGGGPGGTILIDLGTRTYNVPAGNTNWLPTGDQNSILSWQGSTVTPDLCGGFPMDNAKGAVFTATVLQNPATGSLVDFRFKYRDPAAKGKPNTDCTNAADPNRNKADVCGASWSQTVTDP